MDRKLVGLVALFLLFFGAFIAFMVFDTANFQQPLRASNCISSASKSYMFVFPLEIGKEKEESSISVFVRDGEGVSCPGKTVSVSATIGTVSPNTATSDKNGKAQFTFNCSEAGVTQLTSIIDGSVTVEQTASVACS